MLQRVAVVGAGAAGLCAARHILSRPGSFAPPVVFELTDNIGGTWCYDERVGTHANGQPVHSSMYRDLRWVYVLLMPSCKTSSVLPWLPLCVSLSSCCLLLSSLFQCAGGRFVLVSFFTEENFIF